MSLPPENSARPEGLKARVAACISGGTVPPPARLPHAQRHMFDTLAAIISGA